MKRACRDFGACDHTWMLDLVLFVIGVFLLKCGLSHFSLCFSLCFLVTCLLDFSTLPSLRAAASPLQRAGISDGRVMAASAPRGLMCDVLCPLRLLSVLLF